MHLKYLIILLDLQTMCVYLRCYHFLKFNRDVYTPIELIQIGNSLALRPWAKNDVN